MPAPSINIVFVEKAASSIKRGERGIVMLLVKDMPLKDNPVTVTTVSDIPELSAETKEQVKLALMGYVNAPKKVLVYCMGINEDATEEEIESAYTASLKAIEPVRFDYLAIPTVETDGKAQDIASWVKSMRTNKKKKIKAVLPNAAADNEGVINYTTAENIKTETAVNSEGKKVTTKTVYTAEQYCARIAGLIAGTPLTISCTYAPLNDLSECTCLDDIDTPVDKGEFIAFYDGEKVKVVRGVNSLVTLTQDKGASFQKIKIVEAMDMIHDDIRKTAEDSYFGKYANSYDNKCILITAIKGYFSQLVMEGIVSSFGVDIDIEAQRAYLQGKGIDVEEMSDDEIKTADTGSKVFLTGTVKILDAMEDIDFSILI